jgi:hypothetical protein
MGIAPQKVTQLKVAERFGLEATTEISVAGGSLNPG